MVNYQEASLDKVSVHYIGRQSEQEGYRLSDNSVGITSDVLQSTLLRYFLSNFKDPQFFAFELSESNPAANDMYNWCDELFEEPDRLHEISQKIAKHLYEKSDHPAIKHGELLVTHILDVVIDDEMVEAIGIFKSETKDTFLKLQALENNYGIDQHTGIAIDKLDKACLILNTEKSDGYKLCLIDHSNKNQEAVFWRNDFLNVTYRDDNYHSTTVYIQATKEFIDEKLKPEFALDKKDEADILNASKDYFKNAERFDESNYLDSIFSNDQIKEEFNNFKDERQLDLAKQFNISEPAVKKNNGIFKSVIKLDRNFSLYIHGNRNMIEKGEDDDGRKFYKLFYNEEK